MKPIWDRNGQLSDYGKRLSVKAEAFFIKFYAVTGARGREVLDVEALLSHALLIRGTFARLRTAGLAFVGRGRPGRRRRGRGRGRR